MLTRLACCLKQMLQDVALVVGGPHDGVLFTCTGFEPEEQLFVLKSLGTGDVKLVQQSSAVVVKFKQQ